MSRKVADHYHQASHLVADVTCPNCWHRFPPDQILFIARHDSLTGDDVAGQDAYRRFMPTRFDVKGDALDAHGLPCQQLACPRCHLEISRPLIEMMPFFLSIVVVPASGKSYLLAAMTWAVRSVAPRFGVVFGDGDPTANYELQRYEEMLFMNPQPETPVALRKTEIQGTELYQTIVLNGQPQSFPRPFQFTLSPTAHARTRKDGHIHRALVLYDNAGEHFLPGQDSTGSPATQHMAESAAICFVFDPVQDPRFRQRCNAEDPQIKFGTRPDATTPVGRQEVILNEMIARVRRYRGLGQTAMHRRPLIMILAKADLWFDGEELDREPIIEGVSVRLDHDRIDKTSQACRKIMMEACPEIVSAAEGFSVKVIYLPVSSLGRSPELVELGDNRFYGIRPSAIQPKWVTVPLLWALTQMVPGFERQKAGEPSAQEGDGHG